MKIGGKISLDDCMYGGNNSLKNAICTANARSAIHILINEIKPNNVWFPDFLCPSMIQCDNYKFYHVNSNLEIENIKISKNDLVVFINYFGIPYPSKIGKLVKKNGGLILEDASQSMFTPPNPISDFVVKSITKATGLPDGGLLFGLDPIKLMPPPKKWWLDSLDYRKKGAYRASISQPVGYFGMSDFSKNIYKKLDLASMKDGFIKNYNYLKTILGGPDCLAPTGFPIQLQNRDKILASLFKKEIYPAVHWKCGHELSNNILTLPCDYRYGLKDMQHMAKELQKSLDSTGVNQIVFFNT